MPIRVLVTGGTIDCERVEHRKYVFNDTHIPQMLRQGGNTSKVNLEVLMLKDSKDMNDRDRARILRRCMSCDEDKIVITHGTNTMVKTAKLLGASEEFDRFSTGKTIVLTGAMVPFNQDKSDALFNLGGAIAAVQTLGHGVYIYMNGKVFDWYNARKNRKLDKFVETG